MFKRLREGLFKRPEEEATEFSVPEESTEATEAPESPTEESWTDTAEAGYLPGTAEFEDAVLTGEVGEPPTPLESLTSEANLTAEDSELEAVSPAKRGFFGNPFKFSLGRTRQIFGRVNEALEHDDISEELWDELEETLIGGDVGVQTTEKLIQTLRERAQAEGFTRGRQLRDALKEELEILLGDPEPLIFSETSPISVYLVVGVNGVGKTTSIAKLANQLKREKHRVMLAAGDTFRAAATEQIKTWGERIGVPVISHQNGADPGAVVYDAMQAAQARGTDVLIVDTAGRLHTKYNLMEELKKIMKVLQKYDPEAPHEVLLVIDATTGQNGFIQAKQFVQDSGVSGVVLTKLDGTARGGIVFAVASELGLPIKYVGTGEKLQDIAPFDPVQFVDALFEAE
jgi:fused signal recognition particle receptor